MDQRLRIGDTTYAADDPRLQTALAQIYATARRPRCLCVRDGVDMYVAKHSRYVVKRMPGTGPEHRPSCPAYEPEPGQSGLAELMGASIVEHSPDLVELRVNFPLARAPARTPIGRPRHGPAQITAAEHRMSLRAVMHLLFERVGFNRWTPMMAGKRTQAVLHRYLLEAAGEIETKGVRLSERLYIPEQFREEHKAEIAQRRRDKLAILQAPDDDIGFKMALVMGEYKCDQPSPFGRKLWLRHMPDAPLFMDARAWERLKRKYGDLFEARDADTKTKQRVVMCALIYAKREHVYHIDTVSVMLTTENWIPLEGIHEADLIQALTEQRRRFMKPLRYDAKSAAAFPNALLLDTGVHPTALHVISALQDPRDRMAKEKAIKAQGTTWVWFTDRPMPTLPEATHARVVPGTMGGVERVVG